MKSIQAKEKSVKELFGSQYEVDSYQREYKWEHKQVDDLLNDLLEAFGENYKKSHEQKDVKGYDQYFLGSILVGDGDGVSKSFIIDGQQRLTTLTLILICLRRKLIQNKEEKNEEEKEKDTKKISKLSALIRSDEYGTDAFILDVSDRAKCLEAIYKDDPFDVSRENESVRNLVERCGQIHEQLEEMNGLQLPLFIEWLIEKVHLVVITASSSKTKHDRIVFADRIFQTMNDRGLNLTPTEMLKGYLLSQITDDDRRNRANKEWKKQVERLNTMNKAVDSEAIKSWLRSQHAKDMRDFDAIGAQFHRWVRDSRDQLGLKNSDDFESFIETDFNFYAKRFYDLRQSTNEFVANSGMECVFYLEQHSFTLQYPILLASLNPGDSELEIKRKIGVVSSYLDILIHQRIGHRTEIAERTMRPLVFSLIPKIRNKNATEIANFLTKWLEGDDGWESTLEQNFVWHGGNRKKIHQILARITDYIETQSGKKAKSHYLDYVQGFQIEHIWRERYDAERKKEFSHKYDFDDARNRIGDLLLLPSKDNASYGDLPYKEKRDHYLKQNLLAASLHEKCYKRNPGFTQFVQRTGLAFAAHQEFNLAALEKRQELYRAIADQIWNFDRLHEAAQS